jgi:hypothetical protein
LNWLLLPAHPVTAVASADEDMVRSARSELGYRTDICRVSKCSNVEHL